jgi:uncharacterized protein (TIGR03437 family)
MLARFRLITSFLLNTALCSVVVFSFPIIPSNVVAHNAATNQGDTVAPGSLLAVSGGFAFFFPDILDTYTVVIRPSDGSNWPLKPFPASKTSPDDPNTIIWVALPPSLPLGPATVELLRDGESVLPVLADIRIVETSPALFTNNYAGWGPALAMDAMLRRVTLTNTTTPGSFAAVYATGLGGAHSGDVTVEAGGVSAVVSYAGPSQFTGVDQINFEIPNNEPTGCYVPVKISVRGIASNRGTIPVNLDPSACAHPLGGC